MLLTHGELTMQVLAENVIALDWQHECFRFSPSEKSAYAETLPTYYPDGDYHFFIDGNWRFGLFGVSVILQIIYFVLAKNSEQRTSRTAILCVLLDFFCVTALLSAQVVFDTAMSV